MSYVESIRYEKVKARKNHVCDACSALIDGMVYPDDFNSEEVEILRPAFEAGWNIKKGEIYERQTNKMDGEIYTFKARPEVLPIYFKYNMNDI
jgi:hypothetical protein